MERTVKCCPRCGAKHENLKFKELARPGRDYNYWAICPTRKEPIIASVSLDVLDEPDSMSSGALSSEVLSQE